MSRDQLFREVGETLFLAQALELNVRTIIQLVNRQSQAGIDEDLIVNSDDKRTLGQLIQEMKKLGELNQEAADTLREALESRNYVAHHFFIRNGAFIKGDSDAASALNILGPHATRIAAGAAATSGFVHSFCHTFKIDPSTIRVANPIE